MADRATREALGATLIELVDEGRDDIVVLDADLAKATTTVKFKAAHPERFFDFGIAEQNMIGTAAGLAAGGKTPFASSFAVFATGRAYDQVRNSVCYANLGVKIAATHAGVTVGPDGGSHQMVEDIALMRVLPNMQVLVPSDFTAACAEIQKAKDAGQIKGFTGNDYTKPLASGDTAACVAWTGDIVQLKADNPSLGYALPAKGFMYWSDNFVIPNLAKHKKNAETVINYYYDPAVMAQVVDYVNYISPVKGSKAVLMKSDPPAANNPLIFPSPEVLTRARIFRGLTAAEETKYNRKFQAVVTG